jgi:hypothetical protein
MICAVPDQPNDIRAHTRVPGGVWSKGPECTGVILEQQHAISTMKRADTHRAA